MRRTISVAAAERSGSGRKRQLRWKHYYSLAADSPTGTASRKWEQAEQQKPKIRILLTHNVRFKKEREKKTRTRRKKDRHPSSSKRNQSRSVRNTLESSFQMYLHLKSAIER
jgi:hypothetical protein